MQHSSYPRDAIAFGRLRRDDPGCELDLSAYPKPRPLGPTPPRVLRRARAPLAGEPVHAGLARAVDRWRRAERARPEAPHTVQRIMPMGVERRQHIVDRLTVAVLGLLFVWVGVPVAATLIAGAL